MSEDKQHQNHHHQHAHGGHHHSHGHHHEFSTTKALYGAIAINIILTIAQVIGGLVSGSLSLMADALHNFSDAGALAIAAIAARIAKMPANQRMTYGYKRAEILGALINSTTLIVVGVYLLYEAIHRYFHQVPIDGWTVVYIAGLGIVVNGATALLTFMGAKESVNIRAAFIHNISDMAASVVVVISGFLMIQFQIYIVDLIATAMISIYVLLHAFILIRQCILILMQSTPAHLNISQLKKSMEEVLYVKEAHHLHVWQLDDHRILLEGHIVVEGKDLSHLENIKLNIRQALREKYEIEHTTLEIETSESCLNQGD